eukprot:101370-Pyramimonas_sp.AAC.1
MFLPTSSDRSVSRESWGQRLTAVLARFEVGSLSVGLRNSGRCRLWKTIAGRRRTQAFRTQVEIPKIPP